MTVVFYSNATSPVLAGDMLVSMPGPTGPTDLRMPSHPKGISIPDTYAPTYIPVRLRRKIFVLNDGLAIGAAGPVAHIRAFLSDLADAFGARSAFEYSDVAGFLERYKGTDRGSKALAELSALIVFEAADRHGCLVAGRPVAAKVTSPVFGSVRTIGTGSKGIINGLKELDRAYWQPGQPSCLPGALGANLVLLAGVYWQEFMNPNKVLQEAWGGAYDLIYQDAAKVFQYLDSYTIFLRQLDVEKPEAGMKPVNVLKYERRADLSLIAMFVDDRLAWFGAKDITASDEPVSIKVGGAGFSMNSSAHLSIIAIRKGSRQVAPLVQVEVADPAGTREPRARTLIGDDGRLLFAFHAKHDEYLQEQAMEYYREWSHRFD